MAVDDLLDGELHFGAACEARHRLVEIPREIGGRRGVALQVPAEILTRGLGATESAGIVTGWRAGERANDEQGLARGRRGSARGFERDRRPDNRPGKGSGGSKTALARPVDSTGSTPALTACPGVISQT